MALNGLFLNKVVSCENYLWVYWQEKEVKIWDSGTFAVIDKSANKIIFSIKGKKAKGAYVLLKANFGEFAKSGKNWLLFRKKEDLNNKTKKPKKNG